MSEILFRAKCTDDDMWVDGYISKVEEHYVISDDEGFGVYVNPETVGQFTGLTDKNNGAKIFEGAIIKGKFCNYVIWYDETERAFVYGESYKGGYRHHMSDYLLKSAFPHGIEVIGNIHDNPELLGGGDK